MTFPVGRYFSTPMDIGVEYGGQTRALLFRNRIFVSEGGLRPAVLTFTPRVDWDERRQAMHEGGMLVPAITTPNLYDHYREWGWPETEALDATAKTIDVSGWRPVEEIAPDGRPWRVGYVDRAGQTAAYDYLRGDGTAYLRIADVHVPGACDLAHPDRAARFVGRWSAPSTPWASGSGAGSA
ncbi:MAG: hypothetical protein ABIR34_04590, partial [Marmoricola sp.]